MKLPRDGNFSLSGRMVAQLGWPSRTRFKQPNLRWHHASQWSLPFCGGFRLFSKSVILVKVKSNYWLRTHKFGIRIPKSVEEAKRIDKANHNTLWWEAICKEMNTVRPAFEIVEGKEDDIRTVANSL